MVRWIVLVLAMALPLRGALAAQHFCPWMEGATSAAAMSGMSPEDCAGMSEADGHCTLQTACTATPLLTPSLARMPQVEAPAPQDQLLPVEHSPTLAMPERVPIMVI